MPMISAPQVAGLALFAGCPDSDQDGIPDAEDKCPQQAGIPEFNGCPDSDGDGVIDPEDACPEEYGTVENNGCPIADRDGDGLADDVDECPDLAGPEAFLGCPDSDGDGLVDKVDRCPDTVGPASNRGCPIIEEEVQETLNFVAQNVAFETGRATLRSESEAILDKVVTILRQYPNYSLAIGGHTDSVGNAATNQLLSERRAKSCYDYLFSKGIAAERMSYVGYGETRPIADNRYKDGREQNRRVEFNLYLK